jgi:uncharacterized surface protein with fasciclin (FAS1) repeats
MLMMPLTALIFFVLEEKHMFRKSVLALTTAAAMIGTTAFAGSTKDIVDTAAEAGSFTTLLAAATAAGLVDTLKSDGPFTVFAPTDEAFAALPEGTVENLLLPENKEMLAGILTYHVIAGKVMSTDLTDDMEATTVQGTTVMIDLDNGVMVDDANVVTADIEASNGVIHVIDKVIMP